MLKADGEPLAHFMSPWFPWCHLLVSPAISSVGDSVWAATALLTPKGLVSGVLPPAPTCVIALRGSCPHLRPEGNCPTRLGTRCTRAREAPGSHWGVWQHTPQFMAGSFPPALGVGNDSFSASCLGEGGTEKFPQGHLKESVADPSLRHHQALLWIISK